MNLTGLIFLFLAHFICGNGVLYMFHIRLEKVINLCLSVILGIVIMSTIPVFLEMMHISITATNVVITTCILCVLLNVYRFKDGTASFKMSKLTIPKKPFYEWALILLCIAIIIPAAWRCYYFPPYARDILSGPEVIAEYTVREHTMLNSVLQQNIESTNNHLKPPFISGLQIIYKLLVYPFGQIWLLYMVAGFLFSFYSILRKKLHAAITGVLFVLFLAMPELYGYMTVLLFDYSNMIVFFYAVYFLQQYITQRQKNFFYFSALLFGLATIIRSDTLVLAVMFLPLLWYDGYKKQIGKITIAKMTAAFVAIPYFFYAIWIDVFIRFYMPKGSFALGDQINHNLSDVSLFFNRLTGMTDKYIWNGQDHWAFFINIFIILLIVDFAISRKITPNNKVTLYAIVVVYIGLPLLGYLIPWFDLDNTTKRGLFKILPLMALYLADSQLIQKFSTRISDWETRKPELKTKPVVATTQIKSNKKKK
ncbi:MAG: hypothetical protein JST82_05100 [Bacteroidetes bacterium]|nr:hypothetical protein [Bacteroidota bacterium]